MPRSAPTLPASAELSLARPLPTASCSPPGPAPSARTLSHRPVSSSSSNSWASHTKALSGSDRKSYNPHPSNPTEEGDMACKRLRSLLVSLEGSMGILRKRRSHLAMKAPGHNSRASSQLRLMGPTHHTAAHPSRGRLPLRCHPGGLGRWLAGQISSPRSQRYTVPRCMPHSLAT